MAEIRIVAHIKTGEKNTYLSIASEKREPLNGGNQTWWEPGDVKKKVSDFARFRREKDFRMARLGCGVIAMCDLQCFLKNSFLFSEEQYRAYVSKEKEERYPIAGDPIHYITGLTPYRMKKGFLDFIEKNDLQFEKVKWAPFWLRNKKRKTLECIEKMLRENLPVVCSYHTFKKREKLTLYTTPEATWEETSNGARQYVDSHYMTVTGLYEARGENTVKHILEVVSWGSLYYISYEEYAKKISYFSNILMVKR